jgi:hypothetical protein
MNIQVGKAVPTSAPAQEQAPAQREQADARASRRPFA